VRTASITCQQEHLLVVHGPHDVHCTAAALCMTVLCMAHVHRHGSGRPPLRCRRPSGGQERNSRARTQAGALWRAPLRASIRVSTLVCVC
jgi:hypothetical protein